MAKDKLFTVKDGVNAKDLEDLTLPTFLLLGAVLAYCEGHGVKCVVTSIGEKVEGRKSKTHSTGRAFDLSVKPFESKEQIVEMRDFFNERYEKIAAISTGSLKPTVCVYHRVKHPVTGKSLGWHLHFQTRPMEYLDKMELMELFFDFN